MKYHRVVCSSTAYITKQKAIDHIVNDLLGVGPVGYQTGHIEIHHKGRNTHYGFSLHFSEMSDKPKISSGLPAKYLNKYTSQFTMVSDEIKMHADVRLTAQEALAFLQREIPERFRK